MNSQSATLRQFDLPDAPLSMPKQPLEQPENLWLRLAHVFGAWWPTARAGH